MSNIKTYDPGQIVCTFGGLLITGYADGTFVEVERNSDAFTLTVGSGGEPARARSRDKSGTVKFSLMQSSPVNDLLSAVAARDEAAGTGVGALQIKDLNGTTLIQASNAWIKKLPTVQFAKEIEAREWLLECVPLEILSGGNI